MNFFPEAIADTAATRRTAQLLSTHYLGPTCTHAYLKVSADLKFPLPISLMIVRFGGTIRFGDVDGEVVLQVLGIVYLLLLLLWLNVRLGDDASAGVVVVVVVVCLVVDEEGGLMLYFIENSISILCSVDSLDSTYISLRCNRMFIRTRRADFHWRMTPIYTECV